MALQGTRALIGAKAAFLGKGIGSRIRHVRTTGAWYRDRSGLWMPVVPNQLRTEPVEIEGEDELAWLLEPDSDGLLDSPFDVGGGDWVTSGSLGLVTGEPSIFDGETSAKLTGGGSNERREQGVAGVLSGDTDTAVGWIEGDPTNLPEACRIQVRDESVPSTIADVRLDMTTGVLTESTGTGSAIRRGRGANGGPLWGLRAHGAGAPGNNIGVRIFPDFNGDGAVWWHYANAEANAYGSSPLDGERDTDEPIDLRHIPKQSLAGYVRVVWASPGLAGLTAPRLMLIGDDAEANPFARLEVQSATHVRIRFGNASGNSTFAAATLADGLEHGRLLEVGWSVRSSDGAVRIVTSVDGGALVGDDESGPSGGFDTDEPWSGPYRSGTPDQFPRHWRSGDLVVDPDDMDADPLRGGDADADVMAELRAAYLGLTPTGVIV